MIHSYPWYIKDWLLSEARLTMTLEERGLYRDLLDHFFDQGSLPVNEAALLRMAACDPKEFRRAWPTVRTKFEERDGRLYNQKAAEILATKMSRREANARNGSSGGLAKAENQRSKTLANTEDDNESDNDPGFNSFWKMFPSFRKHAKGKARIAWKRAREKAAEEVILAAVEEYDASEVAQTQFVKGPEPWLNGECWDDDREAWKQRDGKTGTTRDGSRHRYKGD